MTSGGAAKESAAARGPTDGGALEPWYEENAAGTLTAWSDAAQALFGYTSGEIVGQPAACLHSNGMSWDRQRFLAQVLHGETVAGVSAVLRTKQGQDILVMTNLEPVFTTTGQVTGVRTIIEHAQEVGAGSSRALESAAWIRGLVDTAVDGIIMINEAGLIEYFNPAAQNMFGYAAKEVTGKNISILMPAPYRHEHDDYIARYLRTGQRRIIGIGREVAAKRKDGSVFPIHLAVSEFQVGGRRLFTGIVRDITEQRRTQEEKDRLLREIDRRNKEITCLYRVGETIWSHEKFESGMFETVASLIQPALSNPGCARIRIVFDGVVYQGDTCEGRKWHTAADIVVGDRKRGTVDVCCVACDSATGGLLQEERGFLEAIAKMLGEAASRSEAEAQLIQASKLASIGELAAGVGHEINNPINGIINCADILIRMSEDGSKQRQFAELVRSEANRIAAIVQNLLTFSRQDKEHHSPARIQDIVDTVLSLCKKKLAHSHVDLHVNLPDDLPKIKCRSEQIQQVLMNLIINAMHALDDKYPGPDPDKILSISAEQLTLGGAPFIRLVIEDHGCGISPVHLERIFDPFFTTKGRDQGTGLGLSVSDGIVKAHGGSISVVSDVGRFTRFQVDLPMDNGWVLEAPPAKPDSPPRPDRDV